jgi:dCTP diphosphatase
MELRPASSSRRIAFDRAAADTGPLNSPDMTKPLENVALVDVSQLTTALRAFADERDWGQFHSPKNLAMALSGEVGELVEIFQWMTEDDSRRATAEPERAKAIAAEMADVLLYLVRMADMLGIDLNEAAKFKLAFNARKYPADLSKGSSQKRLAPKD